MRYVQWLEGWLLRMLAQGWLLRVFARARAATSRECVPFSTNWKCWPLSENWECWPLSENWECLPFSKVSPQEWQRFSWQSLEMLASKTFGIRKTFACENVEHSTQDWRERTPISHEPLICSKMCFTKTELVQNKNRWYNTSVTFIFKFKSSLY